MRPQVDPIRRTRRVRALNIGPIRLDLPAILAGLAGYSDLPYRSLCRRFGAPYCTTEVMLDRQLLLPGKLRRRLVRIGPDDHPLAGQIMGNDPAVMAEAARALQECGFDVVDLNFACPVRKALARRRGGYLLRDPRRAEEILRAVVAATDLPVTVKLRRAFEGDDRTEGSFWRIAEAAFDAGVVALCVHARTVRAGYTGRADWEFLARIKQRFGEKTIIGSGDVTGPAAAVAMMEQTGVDGVALARAALGNPWIFRQLRDYLAGRPLYRPPLGQQRAVLEAHFAQAVEIYGPRRGPKIMRKFGIKYARLHPAPARVRAAFVAVKTADDWAEILRRFYEDPCRESRPGRRLVRAPAAETGLGESRCASERA